MALLLATLIASQSPLYAQRGRPLPHPKPPTSERWTESVRRNPSHEPGNDGGRLPSLSHISSVPLPDIVDPLLRDVATTARDMEEIKETDDGPGGLYGTIGDMDHPIRYRLDADPQRTALINRYLSAPISPKMTLLPLFDAKAGFGIIRKFGKVWPAGIYRGPNSVEAIEAFFAAHRGETIILVSHINATTRSFDILGQDNKVVASFPAKDIELMAGVNHVNLMVIGCSSLALGRGVGVPQPITTNEVATILPGLLAARTRLDLHRLISTPNNPVAIDPALLFVTLYGLQIEVIQRRGDDGVFRPVILVLSPPNLYSPRTPELCRLTEYDLCMRSRFDPVFDNVSYRAVDTDARDAEEADARAAVLARKIAESAKTAANEASSGTVGEADSGPGFFAILGKIAAGLLGGVLALGLAVGLLNAVWRIPNIDAKDKQ